MNEIPGAIPKIKVCGITNLGDALLATALGADSLGFNFYPKSARYILPETACAIIRNLPESVTAIGVFVNEDIATIKRIAAEANLAAIQLHGDEVPDYVKEVWHKTSLEIIKAFRVGPDFDLAAVGDCPAHAILLDSYSARERGGTGKTFEWKIAHEVQCSTKAAVYLAGGLSDENVAQAIREVRPFGIDVCSGVEFEPGKKDAEKMKRFFAAVRETI